MINKRTPLIILLALLINYGQAQTTPGSTGQDDSHKPNAKKGGNSTGTVNVDAYTGTGSINVPIYDYSVDGIAFPISLAYNAKGIRVDELASSVGLGWNLLAGGSITREVKGFEDEIKSPAYWSVSDYYSGWLVPGAKDRSYVDKDYDDTEPDVFTINMCGRSLELSFTNNGLSFTTYPKSEIKVQVQTKDGTIGTTMYTNIRSGVADNIGANLNSNFLGFVITDEKGNVFYFERGDVRNKSYKLSSLLTNNIGTYYVTEKWNLVKAVTYGGQEVRFEYATKYVEYTETVAEKITSWNQAPAGSGNHKHLLIEPNYWKGYKSHISKITYPNNTVVSFKTDTIRADCFGSYRLQQIVIENKFDNNVKNNIRFALVHGMFNSPAHGLTNKCYKDVTTTSYNVRLNSGIPAGPQKDSLRALHLNRGLRLCLREIVKYGTDSATTEPYYLFAYDTTNALPYRFSPHKDFYGYYNGTTIVPYVEGMTSQYFPLSIPSPMPFGQFGDINSNPNDWGKNRSHNSTYMPVYSLTRVKNGCGGSDSLVYNGDYPLFNLDSAYGTIIVPNNLVWSDPGYPGGPFADSIDLGYALDSKIRYKDVNDGLCIDKVISKDGFNNDNNIVVEYSYAGGQRFNQGGYTVYKESSRDSVYTNFNVMPNVYLRGSNHGFSEVTITTKGYNNEQLSKLKYTFSNLVYKNASNKTVSCLKRPSRTEYQHIYPIMKKWRMGVVQKVESWDEDNFLTSLNTCMYDSSTGYALILTKESSVSYIRDPFISVTKSMTTTKSYMYDSNQNPTATISFNSKGDTIKTYNQYNYNYSNGLSSTLNTINLANLQFLLSSYTWKKTSTDSVLLSVSFKTPLHYMVGTVSRLKFFTTFNSNLNVPLTAAQVFPVGVESSFVPKTVVGYTGTGWGAMTASSLEKSAEVTKYDTSGNPIEMIGTQTNEFASLSTGEYNSSIWDTYNGKVIAEVANSTYKNIAYTSFEGTYYALNSNDYNKGNWDFTPAGIKYFVTAGLSNVITGKYCYQITSTNQVISKPLEAKKYKLSFWVNDSTKKPDIKRYTGATPGTSLTYTSSSNRVGDWVLYTFDFTAVAGQSIRIIRSGTNDVYIDEIRLHPSDAMMTSYTYEPLLGKSSSTDANNYIDYYTYDLLGAPLEIKDMRGNVIQSAYSRCRWDDTDTSPNYDPESPQNPNY